MILFNVLFGIVLEQYAVQLDRIIEHLDASLPLTRKTKTIQVYVGNDFLGSLMKTPQTHPNLFEAEEKPLPHSELDELRLLMGSLFDSAEQIRQNKGIYLNSN